MGTSKNRLSHRNVGDLASLLLWNVVQQAAINTLSLAQFLTLVCCLFLFLAASIMGPEESPSNMKKDGSDDVKSPPETDNPLKAHAPTKMDGEQRARTPTKADGIPKSPMSPATPTRRTSSSPRPNKGTPLLNVSPLSPLSHSIIIWSMASHIPYYSLCKPGLRCGQQTQRT